MTIDLTNKKTMTKTYPDKCKENITIIKSTIGWTMFTFWGGLDNGVKSYTRLSRRVTPAFGDTEESTHGHMETHGHMVTHRHMEKPTCIWHIWQSLPSLRLKNIIKCWIKVKFTNHKWKTRQLFGFHLLFINFAIINSDLIQTMFDSQFSLDWQWYIIPCFGIVFPHV